MKLKKYTIEELKELKVENYTSKFRYDTSKIDEETLNTICQELLKQNKDIFLTPIHVSVREDGSKYILDGKHRVKALLKLVSLNMVRIIDFNIKILEVEYSSYDEEVQEYINMHKSLSEVKKSNLFRLNLEYSNLTEFENKIKLTVDNLKLFQNVNYDFKFNNIKYLLEAHNLTTYELIRLYQKCYSSLAGHYGADTLMFLPDNQITLEKYIKFIKIEFQSKQSFILMSSLIFELYNNGDSFLNNLDRIEKTISYTTFKFDYMNELKQIKNSNEIKKIAFKIIENQHNLLEL